MNSRKQTSRRAFPRDQQNRENAPKPVLSVAAQGPTLSPRQCGRWGCSGRFVGGYWRYVWCFGVPQPSHSVPQVRCRCALLSRPRSRAFLVAGGHPPPAAPFCGSIGKQERHVSFRFVFRSGLVPARASSADLTTSKSENIYHVLIRRKMNKESERCAKCPPRVASCFYSFVEEIDLPSQWAVTNKFTPPAVGPCFRRNFILYSTSP